MTGQDERQSVASLLQEVQQELENLRTAVANNPALSDHDKQMCQPTLTQYANTLDNIAGTAQYNNYSDYTMLLAVRAGVKVAQG